jgi:hypothetical protein
MLLLFRSALCLSTLLALEKAVEQVGEKLPRYDCAKYVEENHGNLVACDAATKDGTERCGQPRAPRLKTDVARPHSLR